MDFTGVLSKELNWPLKSMVQAVQLLEEGNTIPFIARYRKEATGEMDEEVLRSLAERLEYLKNLTKRKEEVLRLIDEQGKLTPELEKSVNNAVTMQQMEDIYRPFRPKRRTRASVAREKGLEPLAQFIKEQSVSKGNIISFAREYVNLELEVNSPEEALAGARDIIAEEMADDPSLREIARRIFFEKGMLVTKGKANEPTPYEMYYEYQESVKRIPPHRILAINRGEKEEILQVNIVAPEEEIIVKLLSRVVTNSKSVGAEQIREAVADGTHRLLFPSLEREIRKELTEKGEKQAIMVFSKNLRNLLLQPPVRGQVVLGIDPGFRTGSKLAVVDDTGKLLEVGVIFPHPPQGKKKEAKEKLKVMFDKWKVTAITIGNGTASRETEALVAELIREENLDIKYTIVSEAGASVYSASKLAKEEFPDLDLSYRSGASIARRIQDPLAELVKIDPKSIGVGQYQHDVNAKELSQALEGVVESCVNTVGVELNTASPSLLKNVAGLSSAISKSIVERREKKGKFRSRRELLDVPRLGERTYQQCAGFIRIAGGDNPLENTPVHPESYELTQRILAMVNCNLEDICTKEKELGDILEKLDIKDIAQKLDAGVPTVRDIVEALKRPGRDPREDLPPVILRQDVLSLDDLQEGMILTGTVRNVVDFGAFVDIGVKQDGMVHLSQLSDKYIKHPMEVISVGDVVKVKVLSIDKTRGRIGLTMKSVN
ncbi:MAG: Tex family protein [Clostridia bacterium]|nr:Tex family protein [Clostridia bacterium]MDD4048842.1 Tex family protein [Clostridia bacterium]